ncbi:MAG TPA: M2 family metallopeptidase [Thermoanaerobaculia bacterium]|nr:M2 family metallopeptidase [Thermoanaerobaculia bacterium]
MTRSHLRLRPAAPAVLLALLLAPPLLADGKGTAAQPSTQPSSTQPAGPPTVEEARRFVEEAEKRLLDLSIEAGRASWVQANFITQDTEFLAAKANDRLIEAGVELAMASTRYADLDLPPDLRRKLELMRQSLTLPAPDDPAKREELTRIAAQMESMYGAGEHCPKPGDCKDLQELSRILAESRDPAAQLEAWTGWHSIAPPIRPLFQRYVELGNEGAHGLGYPDLGALWRSKYDMPPDDFAAEVDRLWGQVKPLYDPLHCYVRARLAAKYGPEVVSPEKPIPAHLLGNMWAQNWTNIYELVAPPQADPGYDLNERLKAKKVDEKEMVRFGERFFSSLGFDPLPETFWERSLFKQPQDREVVCHASAWDLDYQDDLRIKMCIEGSAEDFSTIHHELGHNYYQRAYKDQPFMFQDSANDAIHEAVGDAVALSITPEYLKQVGLIDEVPDPSKDLGFLMNLALDKIAFLPFGLLIDQWRWKVFSGELGPEEYNATWWQLREKYQGIAAPVARSEQDFDPGAKYHVPASVPYTRYFLAAILQFQLHRGLCQAAGHSGPLHRCSIYGNKEAGARLERMLEMGLSRPWPDAIEGVTGQRLMDATAILDYFAPLKTWLEEQNRGRRCGW